MQHLHYIYRRLRKSLCCITDAFFLFVTYYLFCTSCSVTQSCLTLCEPPDCRPPGSSVHGISQARIPEWVAISSSRGSSRLGIKPALLHLLHWQADSLPLCRPGRPFHDLSNYNLLCAYDNNSLCYLTKSLIQLRMIMIPFY